MTTFSAPTGAEVGHKKPVTVSLINKALLNPIAMFEGAAGAPRLADQALGGSATADGINWVSARLSNSAVGARIAEFSAGQVGSYAFLILLGAANHLPNTLFAGSGLRWANAAGNGGLSGAPGGTWRLMGELKDTGGSGSTSLFLRVA